MDCCTLSKGPGVVANGCTGIIHSICVGEVSVHFQLKVKTLGFLSVPTDKNLKDCGQHTVQLCLEHSWWAYINMNSFLCFGVRNSLLKFVQAL